MSSLFAFVNNQVEKIILLMFKKGLFGFAIKFIHILEEDISLCSIHYISWP